MKIQNREKKQWVQLMLRLEPPDAQNLKDTAHAAGLPIGVYVREILLGKAPRTAPPSFSELGFETQGLLKICHSIVANLHQLSDHALRLAQPFPRLEEPLKKLSNAARNIGLDIKSGNLIDDHAIKLFNQLQAPSDSLNALAKAMNSGEPAVAPVWLQVLNDLQNNLNVLVAMETTT